MVLDSDDCCWDCFPCLIQSLNNRPGWLKPHLRQPSVRRPFLPLIERTDSAVGSAVSGQSATCHVPGLRKRQGGQAFLYQVLPHAAQDSRVVSSIGKTLQNIRIRC